MDDIMKKLQAPFDPEDVDWRAQSCGVTDRGPWAMVLAYIQARAVQERLDLIFGWDGWTDEYRHESSNVICRLGVKTESGWIYKENGASNTDIEAFKGGISGAFKRVAASGYGIGRYLYNLTESYAECTLEKPHNMKGWHKAQTKAQSNEKRQTIYWKEPQLPKWALPEGYSYTTQIVATTPTKPADATKTSGATSTYTCSECAIYIPENVYKFSSNSPRWKRGLCVKCQKTVKVEST